MVNEHEQLNIQYQAMPYYLAHFMYIYKYVYMLSIVSLH